MMLRWEFPDPTAAILDLLRGEFPDVTFGTRPPKPQVDGGPLRPYVAVLQLDQTVTARVAAESAMRLTVWHTSAAKASALARRMLATLLAYPGGPALRTFAHVSGPVPVVDETSSEPLSTFSVLARLRPVEI